MPAKFTISLIHILQPFKDVSVEEMRAFTVIKVYMDYLYVKPNNRDYWPNDGADILGNTPGFRNIRTCHQFCAVWTFLYVIDEESLAIDNTD